MVEGLSASGEQYKEAVDCLKRHPRLLHQAHVKAILDAPALNEGTWKELRRLHDIATQHLRALKAIDCELPGPFVTSMIELKLDQTTMFEWQRHIARTHCKFRISTSFCLSISLPRPVNRPCPSRTRSIIQTLFSLDGVKPHGWSHHIQLR